MAMKKIFKCGIALLVGLFATLGVSAQAPMQNPPMPVDSAVRVGVLPNGLTYYIRHNETPKGQADFYIAQKVGSILEEDNQRGLAHFLEHMCFNGTENFPGNSLRDWLESVGVKFGYNLNAYTSIDETVYNISSVPVARKSVQDSCLLILHDWACALTLDHKEIDKERGVIHEEWRRSMAGQMRILEEQLPVAFPNNRYGERLPIGTMEVIDNFPYEALVDYYRTWYRPDQQGVIVVGDIDPDYIEAKIKELFSHIQMPENAKERVYLPVEDTPGTIYAIGKDPEQSMAVAMMSFKFEPLLPRELRNTQAFYGVNYLTRIVTSMLNSHLSDIANTPNSPFAQASVYIGDFVVAKTKQSLTLEVVGKGNDIRPALEAAYREVLRAVRGGFTVSEFERANAELRSQYQKLYDSRNNMQTDRFSRELVRSFIDNDPIPGIEVEKQIFDMMTQAIPVEQVNTVLPELVKADNRVLIAMLPDAEGYVIPTADEFAAGLATVDAETIEPYKEELKSEPLIPALPTPGSIVSERALDAWGATAYTLSNGVKVVVKPTNLKENEIIFQAVAKGGYSEVPAELAESIIFMPYAISNNGLGTYTNSDLKKYLQGKQASVGLDIDEYSRKVSGQSTIADLPTLMELIHANFTEFTIFPDEFAAAQGMIKGVLANQEATPEYVFGKLATETLCKSPLKQKISSASIDKADCTATVALINSMLANAKDFTFCFVGNIDLDTFKPLLEQYIATLPTEGASVAYSVNPDVEIVKGANTITESTAMATPQTWAMYYISGNMSYTPKSKAVSSMVAQIMRNRLLNKVREEMGATYSIGAQGVMNRLGDNNTHFQIAFPMKPELSADVQTAIDVIFEGMGKDVTEAELNPIKEYMVKNAVASLEENDDWASAIVATTLNGVDTFNGAADVINSVTVEDIQNFWKEVVAQGNRQVVFLNPAE